MHEREIDLTELATEVGSGYRVRADESKVRLVGPRSLLTLADPDRVGQALANLITNGVRHAAPGGQMTVSGSGRHNESKDSRLRHRPWALPQAAERFTRAARSGDFEGDNGTGLGPPSSAPSSHGTASRRRRPT